MDNNTPLRVLLIGKGGRESALAWKLSQSPLVEKILVLPGNAGTDRSQDEKISNVTTVKEDDFEGLVKLAKMQRINLVDPGTLWFKHLCPSESFEETKS